MFVAFACPDPFGTPFSVFRYHGGLPLNPALHNLVVVVPNSDSIEKGSVAKIGRALKRDIQGFTRPYFSGTPGTRSLYINIFKRIGHLDPIGYLSRTALPCRDDPAEAGNRSLPGEGQFMDIA